MSPKTFYNLISPIKPLDRQGRQSSVIVTRPRGFLLGDEVKVKRCSQCKKEKEFFCFYKDDHSKNGVRSACKECCRAAGIKYYKEHPHSWKSEKRIIAQAKYRKSEIGRKRRKEGNKKYRLTDKGKQSIQRITRNKRSKRFEWMLRYLGIEKLTCSYCGYNKSEAAIQFHHNNPSEKKEKRDTLSIWITSCTNEDFKNKIKNTDFRFLCANCHTEYHAGLWK